MRFDIQPQEKETTAIATQVTKMKKKNLHDFQICIFGLIDLQLESLSNVT